MRHTEGNSSCFNWFSKHSAHLSDGLCRGPFNSTSPPDCERPRNLDSSGPCGLYFPATAVRYARFSPYTACLEHAYTASKDRTGTVTPEAWARNLINIATRLMCGRPWAAAFEETGFVGNCTHLTRDVASIAVSPVMSPAQMPPVRVVRDMTPRNRRIPYNQLLSEPLGHQVRVRLL